MRWSALLLAPLTAALLVFWPRITGGGFTGDDWYNRAAMLDRSAGDVLRPLLESPLEHRVLHIPYISLYDAVLGADPIGYLAWAVVSAGVLGSLVALLLQRMGVPWWAAVATATLGVLHPYASMTKIWMTAHVGHVSTSLAVLGLLAAQRALRTRGGRSAPWHVLSTAFLLASLALYEIALPFVLLSGVFHWLVLRTAGAGIPHRPLLLRWLADVTLLAAWALAVRGSTAIASGTETSLLDRAWVIAGDGAKNVLGTFVPFLADTRRPDGEVIYSGAWFPAGPAVAFTLALVALGATLVVVAHRRGQDWLKAPAAALLAALVAAFLGWLAIVPAGDFYRPVPPNAAALRVNVLAAFGLAGTVVAVVVLAMRGAGHVGPVGLRRAAVPLTAIALLGLGVAYARHIRAEITNWNTASREQVRVLEAVRAALDGRKPLPGTAIFLTDNREYIADDAEVFFTSWSFAGAVRTIYDDWSLEGTPHRSSARYQCRPEGLAPYFLQYRTGRRDAVAAYPSVVLVSVEQRRAWRMGSQAACRRVVQEAGLALVGEGEVPPPLGSS